MAYTPPADVTSPRQHWELAAVLLDGGAGKCSYAVGTWDGEPRLAMRWNGTTGNPVGNPQSRGLPTWTMLDPKLHDAVMKLLPRDERTKARRFFGMALDFDGVTVKDDRSSIVLWCMRERPPVVAVIECRLIRDLIGKTGISEDQCRLLVDANKAVFADAADALFYEDRLKNSPDKKVRIIELTADDLKPVRKRISTSVLDIAALTGFGFVRAR